MNSQLSISKELEAYKETLRFEDSRGKKFKNNKK